MEQHRLQLSEYINVMGLVAFCYLLGVHLV